jgi:hypothetical protein
MNGDVNKTIFLFFQKGRLVPHQVVGVRLE